MVCAGAEISRRVHDGSGNLLRAVHDQAGEIVRLYLYAAVALALIGLGIYAKHQHDRAAKLQARAESVEASITALRAAHAHEQRIAKEASNAYQKDLARLNAERSQPMSVRLCKPARNSVPAPAAAPERTHAATTGHVGEETAPDIGPDIGAELLEYGLACQANALQLDRLQQWVRSRDN